ncbi:TlpA family protein disulfide reductase [Pseudaminobacter sp. 19-2017]|uniref:TlpA family protein disulfide reductase n=1 Tax=Pseudaminobacter soli (ex Zhang et al. 2022) TaxID=2831468 RepID=A0A942IBR1_9HYPH|nr:TlpA disulfide reductase family protein [Pseudaminobacter soli]MBS3652550.1 TlpA family protein disulfide reductase [Pseudaminobacter soli]
MNAVTLGPLVLAADRYAVVLGIFAFVLITAMLTRRIDGRFQAWSSWVLFGGGAAARAGHVVVHWNTFTKEPLRIFAFWDGGFYWPAGLAAVLLSVLLVLRTARLRLWSLLPLAVGLAVWNTAWQLSGGTSAIALPASTFETLAGGQHALGAAGTAPKVINLWASWCPPCRREMPMMAEVAAASEGTEFIFANQGESRDVIKRYLEDAGVSLNTVLLDPFGGLARHYGAPGLPATLFVGADGTLKHAHLGEISRETLQSRISELQPEDD